LHAGRRWPDWSWLVAGLSAALLVLALIAELRRPINPDAAWLLYSAGRLLRGEHLYSDILEINPPLIIWLNLPVAWLSQATGVSDGSVFRGAVLLLIAASCAAWVALLARLPGGLDAPHRRVQLAAVAFVLLPLVDGMFGQREHLLMALAFPLVALTALRIAGSEVARPVGFLVGLAAGLGFGLKPHYGAAWLLLVGYRWWAGSRSARRVLPEDLAVLLVGILYPALVVLLTPDYFPFVAHVARDYMSYGAQPLWIILVQDSPALWFYLAIVAWLILDRSAPRSPVTGSLAALGLGTLVAIAAQHKGWSYHYLPLTGCALLLAVGTMWPLEPVPAESQSFPAARWSIRWLYGASLALFVGAMGSQVIQRAFGPLEPREQRQIAMRRSLEQQTGAHSILVLSSSLRDGFPLVNDSRLRWNGGYPNVWVPLVYYRSNKGPSSQIHLRSPDAMSAGERAAFDRVVQDVVDGRPDILVVESPELNARRMEFPGGFDFLRYFSQDPRCAAALAQYSRDTVVDSMWVFRRQPGK
jgi:hypothetical protein